MEKQDNMFENDTLPEKDIDRFYSELLDEVDKAKQPIIDKISPELYVELYLFRIQLEGIYMP